MLARLGPAGLCRFGERGVATAGDGGYGRRQTAARRGVAPRFRASSCRVIRAAREDGSAVWGRAAGLPDGAGAHGQRSAVSRAGDDSARVAAASPLAR